MSPRRVFEHFMVHKAIGRNRKLRRSLTPDERWCYVAGVLAIAADAPIRGRLLIGMERADEQDVADEAGVRVAVARSALKKLRELEMVVDDDELDCERVHDWEAHNPEPKRDATAAERMRRYRDKLRRNNDRNGNRNEDRNGSPVTALPSREVEVEGEVA